MSTAELRVESNTPRLLEQGELPPDTREDELPPEVPQRYWTPDKAAHVVARIAHAGSKFYGPSVKAAEWELDLISDPAAAVMNDWLPLRVGASGDKQANLIALVVVVFILVLLRLPDILEVHGVIKPWRSPEERLRDPDPPKRAKAAPAQPDDQVPEQPTTPFEPQLVGVNGSTGGSDDRKRDEIFGATTVGGSKFAGGVEPK